MQNISFPRLQIFFLYFCPLLCVECVYFFHFWISNGGIRIWMLFHLCNFLVMHVCVCVCVCNALFWYTFLHYVWLCELWATTWSLRHAMLWYVMRGSAAIEFWICSRLLLLPLMAVAGKPVYSVHTQHVLATEAFFVCVFNMYNRAKNFFWNRKNAVRQNNTLNTAHN